jgi:hypothetical protein
MTTVNKGEPGPSCRTVRNEGMYLIVLSNNMYSILYTYVAV